MEALGTLLASHRDEAGQAARSIAGTLQGMIFQVPKFVPRSSFFPMILKRCVLRLSVVAGPLPGERLWTAPCHID